MLRQQARLLALPRLRRIAGLLHLVVLVLVAPLPVGAARPLLDSPVAARHATSPMLVAATVTATTMRSLSVSYQGESFFYQTSRAPRAASPSSPAGRRGPTPERRKSVSSVPEAENARPQHRWHVAKPKASDPLARSLDCNLDHKDSILAAVQVLCGSMAFDWEEKPGTPKPGVGSGATATGDGENADFAMWSGVLLDRSAQEPDQLPTADELFDEGKIRPLKPPPRLLDGGSVGSSPRSWPRLPVAGAARHGVATLGAGAARGWCARCRGRQASSPAPVHSVAGRLDHGRMPRRRRASWPPSPSRWPRRNSPTWPSAAATRTRRRGERGQARGGPVRKRGERVRRETDLWGFACKRSAGALSWPPPFWVWIGTVGRNFNKIWRYLRFWRRDWAKKKHAGDEKGVLGMLSGRRLEIPSGHTVHTTVEQPVKHSKE
ncbi:uncharacterized protein LOC125553739 [Triticum urartu]|uniref:uncharacterized protein LOC125553739 n=1 Tax=Triticum urartu TaxID=4572 RepID=UPI002043D406|nr:uncharacterized protein LOC125553739 [Triticum urartu]XP_048573423.1 uncharacterized protein LOC125553739 [Triticum urartu]XP_048573424.1 uncharacterized protein LOC125553739 [Triticum urartu]